MTKNNNVQEKDDQPNIGMIQKIKDEALDPRTLTIDERLECVEILLGNTSVPAMAQLLKRSEKTIKRDIEDIFNRNRLSPDTNLREKITSELVMYARIHRDHLMKLARLKEAAVSERSQAELSAAKVFLDMVSKLQDLGYLPRVPQGVVGAVFHVDGKISDLDELTRQIIDIEKITDGDGQIDDGIKKDLTQMKTVLEKIRSSEENNNKKGEGK